MLRIHPDGSATVVAGATELAPFDAITASSRSTVCIGNGLLDACADAKRRLAALAANLDAVPPETVTVENGCVHTPTRTRAYGEVIEKAYGAGEEGVIGLSEFRQRPDPKHPLGGPVLFYEIIYVATEVEVDKEAGQYEVTNLATVADIGKAILPLFVVGQDKGSAMMSLGQAMMEHLLFDARGRPCNRGARDYRIPTTMDLPRRMTSLLLENANGPGPFGAKGSASPSRRPSSTSFLPHRACGSKPCRSPPNASDGP